MTALPASSQRPKWRLVAAMARDQGLGPAALRIAILLLDEDRGEGCWRGHDWLAAALGLSRRSIVEGTAQLVAHGWFRVEPGRPPKFAKRYVPAYERALTDAQKTAHDDAQESAHRPDDRCAENCASDAQKTAHDDAQESAPNSLTVESPSKNPPDPQQQKQPPTPRAHGAAAAAQPSRHRMWSLSFIFWLSETIVGLWGEQPDNWLGDDIEDVLAKADAWADELAAIIGPVTSIAEDDGVVRGPVANTLTRRSKNGEPPPRHLIRYLAPCIELGLAQAAAPPQGNA